MQDYSIIRDQFPIFQREINGKLLVFLDSAASAQKPQVVIDAMSGFIENHYANVNRGIYTLSVESTEILESVRAKVASFIGAKNAEEIVFTKNTTESINLVAYSWARKFLKKGDVVVLSEMEHHSNIVPWHILSKEIGIELKWIGITEDGYLDMEQLSNLAGNIRLVCMTHVSNVLGTINPIKTIAEWAHSKGALMLVDGAQGVTNLSVNVQELDADFYVFSGHKLYGPTGVGVLCGRKSLLSEMNPFLGGGDMILEVHKSNVTYQDSPHRFEAGTPPIVEIVGLGAAIDFVSQIGIDSLREHTIELVEYFFSKTRTVKGLKVFGPTDSRQKGGVVSFTLDGVHPHDIASILDEEGVAIRSGHHCAQPLCDRYGVPAMARVSFGIYNDRDDVDKFFDALHRVIQVFS